jgi:nucleoside-diphosphate-sugar epimerase
VYTRLIPSLVQKFLKGESTTLDACTSVIDYLYVDDFVDQVYALAVGSSVGVYNLCSGNKYCVKDIVEYIHQATASTSKVLYDQNLNRTTVSSMVCGDPTKTIAHTNIKPQVSLQDGLNKVIKFYKTKSI